MIFISYRREDTRAEVTNLHQRLVDRYGEDQVFVDFRDIPIGERWPDTLRRELEKRSVLLVVIGSKWGDARYGAGENTGRLRLDDPDDWVRVEICTGIGRANEGRMRVFVVPIDDVQLPGTVWKCDLDKLKLIQQARLRNQKDFDNDFRELCEGMEKRVPELKPIVGKSLDQTVLHDYRIAELRRYTTIQLPLISQNGQSIVVPIKELRIDLPLVVSHEHAPSNPGVAFLWIGLELLFIHDEFRTSHTNALLVDRASRHEDIRRDCEIGERLAAGSRMVVVGDPGCGKSTLLQWICHHYATDRAEESSSLPDHDWLPLLILCREFVGQPIPTHLADLLRAHLKLRQYSDATISFFVPEFERLLEQGRAILLIDGLDEIPNSVQRIEFSRLLTSVANRFPNAPIVVTSRVVGFQTVREELASNFDHLLVSPLDRAAKRSFLERWAKLIGWEATKTVSLIQQVCHSRVVAKLTENIFLLAMVAQIHVAEDKLPGRRVDVYRRAVQLMVQRRPVVGSPLTLNELAPHLEFLAYSMRKKGMQRYGEVEVLEAFSELRRMEPGEPELQTRSPKELLEACIDSVGILNVAGTEIDRRGFDRRVIQFFHQSFQEYFAGQAINHGHDAVGKDGAVARLRNLLATIEIREREVSILGEYKIVEPVIADYWQEAVRMAIADLRVEEADEAILMLLPEPTTPPPEARARAVFALQCLADEPKLSRHTIDAVFDAMIENLSEGDGFGTALNTRMDEALAAVTESEYGAPMRDRLLDAFIASSGEQRTRIGCCAVCRLPTETLILTTDNAQSLIRIAKDGLASEQQRIRVATALSLTGWFYRADGKLGFLPEAEREQLSDCLVSALDRDEATATAVLWALSWFTGARYRKSDQRDEMALLNSSTIRRIEQALQRSDLDSLGLVSGCQVLTREVGLDLVAHQLDWIYELASIADGQTARRSLPGYRPVDRSTSIEWMRGLLDREMPLAHKGGIALALGAFGIYTPEMLTPLVFLFQSRQFPIETRDESCVYLGLIGNPEAISILIEAAETPHEIDDYLNLRGLLGLLLIDDIEVLAEQLRKASPQADLNAYAFGLAGSRDPRGPELLESFRDHPNERIRTALEKAFSAPWMNSP